MARKIFVLGIFMLAAACGVIGYQILTYYFYQNWPSVSFQFVYNALFGDLPTFGPQWENDAVRWIGNLPVSVVGISLSYLLLFLSDVLRGAFPARAST